MSSVNDSIRIPAQSLKPPQGRKPTSKRLDSRESDQALGRAIRVSMALHGALLFFFTIKSVVFPSTPVLIAPTLRVDIVDLPDVLKKDLMKAPLPEIAKKDSEGEVKKPPKIADPPKTETKIEKAERDEMVLNAKQAAKEKADREKKLRGALARIKALDRIQAIPNEDAEPVPTVIKGNQISKGTSLSGDARESMQATYYDALRERLQENWALPLWLERQKLSAQVQIFIDRSGKTRNFKFLRLSGNAQFDEAVKRTLTQSQPFPIPPDDIRDKILVDGVLIGFPL